MRLRTFSALLLAAALGAEACSLVLPYDEYPGAASTPPSGDAGGDPDDATTSPPIPVVDAGDPVVIDGGGEPDACGGADLTTDPNNCGACGRKCVTGPCTNAKCPIDVLTPNGVKRVVSLDYETSPDVGDALYFTREGGVLGRYVFASSKVEAADTAKATGAAFLSSSGKAGIFAENGAALWHFRTANFTSDPPDRIANRAGLGPVLFAGGMAYFGDPKGLWWAEPKANGAVKGLQGPAAFALTAFDGRVYWVASEGTVANMPAAEPVSSLSVDDVVVSSIRKDQRTIAVSSTHLYLGHPYEGLLVYDLNPTTRKASLPRILSFLQVETVVSDESHVYVVEFPGDRTSGRVLRLNPDGQALTVLADGLEPSSALTLAGDHVYFASGGRIQRTTK